MQSIELPTFPGYWQIGGRMGLCVSVKRRPRWLTRVIARLLLEWEWRDGRWVDNND